MLTYNIYNQIPMKNLAWSAQDKEINRLEFVFLYYFPPKILYLRQTVLQMLSEME